MEQSIQDLIRILEGNCSIYALIKGLKEEYPNTFQRVIRDCEGREKCLRILRA